MFHVELSPEIDKKHIDVIGAYAGYPGCLTYCCRCVFGQFCSRLNGYRLQFRIVKVFGDFQVFKFSQLLGVVFLALDVARLFDFELGAFDHFATGSNKC